MRDDDTEFVRVTTAMREKALAACEPSESSLKGPDHVFAMGAVFAELALIHITFFAEKGMADFARELVEAMEADLIEIRRKNGWLNG